MNASGMHPEKFVSKISWKLMEGISPNFG